MSERAELRSGLPRRGVAPYAERAEERETSLDRFLLAAGAGLKRPLSGALRRAGIVADLTEREQAWADGLSDEKLQIAAGDLRPALVRGGFLPEAVARAFALVRSAAARTVGLRHFSVQLIGGSAMLEGKLVEMGTGEGKTLTATLPAATAALAGMPVHVVTVNDYLARRDAEWMRPVYAALGLTTGIVQHGQQPAERREAYASDITYCTNKDLGFDYLRDGLVLAARRGRGRLLLDKLFGRADRLDRLLLRGLHFALVDVRPLDLVLGAHALVALGARLDVLHFDLHEGAAATPDVNVMGLEHAPDALFPLDQVACADFGGQYFGHFAVCLKKGRILH